jgi:signal transduction histidine kinase
MTLEEARRETELIRQRNTLLEQEISRRQSAEAELRQRAEQLAILRQMDEDMSNILDVDTVSLIALDAALRLSQADAGIVAVTRGEVVTIAQLQGAYRSPRPGQEVMPGEGILGRVMVQQVPELVLDAPADPDYIVEIPGVQAVISLPLLARERLVGMLQVETRHRERFTPDLFEFMKALGGRIAVALENATLYAYIFLQLEETQRLYRKVSRLERLKTDMIRIGAHDLKNPLSAMGLYLEMFQNDTGTLSERQRSYLSPMRQSLKQMRDLVNDILSLERIEVLADQAVLVPLDLSEAVQVAYDRYQSPAAHRQQQLTLTIPEDTRLLVRGDQALLTEAVANLVSNAVKYTPEKGRIHIRVTEEPAMYCVEISDTGYGIPDNLQASLFKPFYRARTRETEEISGTGLGLHLVKNIIERHGGTLHLTSVHGQGSTFGFRLPRLSPAPAGG